VIGLKAKVVRLMIVSSSKHPPIPKGEYSSSNFKIRTYFKVGTTVLSLGGWGGGRRYNH